MGVPDADLTRDIEAATRRLLDTAATLDDSDARAPSQLPGWTRGHVLTHLARNADGLVNLLGWCHGSRTPMYQSTEARDRDIEAGAARSAAELLADVRASAGRFMVALDAVPAGGWETIVELRGGRKLSTGDVPWKRLVEIEVHHADLGVGYTHHDWPERFTNRLLDELVRDLPSRPGMPALTIHRQGEPEPGPDSTQPVVSGSAADLLGWLTGRTDGARLAAMPPGALPALPTWI